MLVITIPAKNESNRMHICAARAIILAHHTKSAVQKKCFFLAGDPLFTEEKMASAFHDRPKSSRGVQA